MDEITRRRIDLYRAQGGLDLGKVEVQVGIEEMKRAIYLFECPLCHSRAENNQAMEPMCTGPSWTNDHPPEVMDFVERVYR